jgi:uncharacterized protein
VKFVDANILLYAVNSAAAGHAKCRRWLEEALAGDEAIAFDWVVLLAFLRISTRATTFDEPLTVGKAIDRLEEWLAAPVVRLLAPTSEHWSIIQELLLAVGTGGNLTTDAHLAALAISHNATLVSCDTDFSRFKRLRWENPLAVP